MSIFQALVRETCKEKLDTHIPFTQQPQEKVESVVNTILDKFPALEELGIRRRVRLFLKSHRHSLRKTLASSHGQVKNIAEEGNQSEEEAITIDGDNNKSFNVSESTCVVRSFGVICPGFILPFDFFSWLFLPNSGNSNTF